MIEISIERYTQLIKAEHDAEMLKNLIKHKFDHISSFDREEMRLIVAMYFEEED